MAVQACVLRKPSINRCVFVYKVWIVTQCIFIKDSYSPVTFHTERGGIYSVGAGRVSDAPEDDKRLSREERWTGRLRWTSITKPSKGTNQVEEDWWWWWWADQPTAVSQFWLRLWIWTEWQFSPLHWGSSAVQAVISNHLAEEKNSRSQTVKSVKCDIHYLIKKVTISNPVATLGTMILFAHVRCLLGWTNH